LLFNSFAFAAFLPLVFFIYWGLGKASLKVQNLFLLVASYIFYGWWDWRFLTLTSPRKTGPWKSRGIRKRVTFENGGVADEEVTVHG
jgi:D-alanyl-lipoteichoic acid acyltransferase DltB (MBOAT superfamily)